MSIQSLKVDVAALQRLPEKPLELSYAERGLAGDKDLSCTGNANGGGQLIAINTNSCLLTCTAIDLGLSALGGASSSATASCDNTL